MYQFKLEGQIIKKGSPGETWTGFRSSRFKNRFSSKLVFLKISQILQENNCFGDSF